MDLSAILTVEQMREADRLTIERGTPGIELMESAGLACAEVIRSRYDPQEVLILCGPGNNGGDGFVIARQLESHGWRARVAHLGAIDRLSGDAAQAAGRWHATTNEDNVEPLPDTDFGNATLLVDALFGTGLDRELEGPFADVIERANASGLPIVAIDIASGINGDRGDVCGIAIEADMTISLAARKPGQLLMPGRLHSGDVYTVDIGIPEDVVAEVREASEGGPVENTKTLWVDHVPWPDPLGHKYTRGHLLCVSGPAFATGACRLAAMSGLRIGAGLVTIAAEQAALPEHAAQLTSIMLRSCDDAGALSHLLDDERLNAIVIGPGCGVSTATMDKVKTVLRKGRAAVLDADALTSFEGALSELTEAISGPTVLTPHWGEFTRLFGGTEEAADRLELAGKAAQATSAVVVLKGPDTIIAAPDGRKAITTNAPPWLATAGSGDVLSGIIGGLMAQGMAPFEAACAGVWIHGEAAAEGGIGLISEDLPHLIPEILSLLLLDGEPGVGS